MAGRLWRVHVPTSIGAKGMKMAGERLRLFGRVKQRMEFSDALIYDVEVPDFNEKVLDDALSDWRGQVEIEIGEVSHAEK